MNKFTRLLTLLVFVSLSMASISFGQSSSNTNGSDEILTNANIIALAKLGLSDAVIIEKIRQSKCNFDTSLAGLTELKNEKISDAVILSIMDSQAAAIPSRETTTATRADFNSTNPADPHEPGIYLSQDGKLTDIDPTILRLDKNHWVVGSGSYLRN